MKDIFFMEGIVFLVLGILCLISFFLGDGLQVYEEDKEMIIYCFLFAGISFVIYIVC